MVKYYSTISPELSIWATSQPIFFIASAPSFGRHINLSPKGLPSTSFAVLSPTQCAYIDATGSGNETISHLNENGRATLMFCSFATSPRILRFFCKGRVVEWDRAVEREELLGRMGMGEGKGKGPEGARAVIVLDVFKVQTSCGFGVPYLGLGRDPEDEESMVPVFCDRDTLGHFARKKVAAGQMLDYQALNNQESLDGRPGLRIARRHGGEKVLFFGDVKAGVRTGVLGLWHLAGATLVVALLSSFSTAFVMYYMGLVQIGEEQSDRWAQKWW